MPNLIQPEVLEPVGRQRCPSAIASRSSRIDNAGSVLGVILTVSHGAFFGGGC
jgi:hypothetical protein